MARLSDGLLTEGPIGKKLIAFTIPIFLGNLFQQLYNTADTLIVGRLIGSDALAAVGSSGNLIFLIVGFFNGLSLGAGVVIARHFGAQEREQVNKAIHNTLLVGLVSSAVVTLIGLVLAPQILGWMGTPEEVMPLSLEYFRTYFAGAVSMVMYNMLAGILQAMGDSRHPLYYLIVASITNVVLDLVFIGVFHWGVFGAAFATVISQALSAVLAFIRLRQPNPIYHLSLRSLRVEPRILRETLRAGLPAGVQNSVTALANVIVQSNINAFGAIAMAGSGAYSKLEGFAFLPVTCFSMALTTFISQNLGAGKLDRARQGTRFGMICSMIMAEIIGVIFFVFASPLMAAFNSDPGVIASGVARARICALFFFLLAVTHCISGVLRGAGRSIIPMIVMLVCWCIIRVSYITITVQFIPRIEVVFWAYPITWILSSAVLAIYYKKAKWLPIEPSSTEKTQAA